MLVVGILSGISGWTCIKNNLSNASIEIDIEGNKKYLENKEEDTANMTEEEIKKAFTGEHVFLRANISILDAMEDFDIDIII